jgi:hypothetical protein
MAVVLSRLFSAPVIATLGCSSRGLGFTLRADCDTFQHHALFKRICSGLESASCLMNVREDLSLLSQPYSNEECSTPGFGVDGGTA